MNLCLSEMGEHARNCSWSGFERTLCPGGILRAEVDGRIFMRAYLSGMPECKLALNDTPVASASIEGAKLYDCQFHQCVRSNEFDSEKTIRFIPPDGEFQLMR